MIAPAVAAEIKRLLRTRRLSQRRIAAQTGVSRGTVNAIALGKRPDYRAGHHENNVAPPRGPLVRCPGCGGKVQMPCVLCRVRELDARSAPRGGRQGVGDRRTGSSRRPRSQRFPNGLGR